MTHFFISYSKTLADNKNYELTSKVVIQIDFNY